MADELRAEESGEETDPKKEEKVKRGKKPMSSAFATPLWAEPDEILGTQFNGREK